MSLKLVTKPVSLLAFTDNSIDSYVADDRELFVDARTSVPKIRLGDGVTPGGVNPAPPVIGGIATPNIITPSNGAGNIVTAPVLSSSDFIGLRSDMSPETHDASDWQIALDSGFSNLVLNHVSDTTNLTSIDLSTTGVTLDLNTLYYVRVRYRSADGPVSEWSPISNFVTTALVPSTLQQALVASDMAPSDYYGISMDITDDGSLAIVAAYGASVGGNAAAGKVYVYDVDPNTGVWTQQQVITSPSPSVNGYFGSGVAITGDGTIAVIGAYAEEIPGDAATNPGMVRVYSIDRATNTWTLLQEIHASDPTTDGYFGFMVDITNDGNMILVGSPGARPGGVQGGGKVYVYTRASGASTWAELNIVQLDNVSAFHSFGANVAIADDKSFALVRSWDTDPITGARTTGRVIAFSIDPNTAAWTLLHQTVGSSGGINDAYGRGLAMSADGTMAVVGGYKYDANGNYISGMVYVYSIHPVTKELLEIDQWESSVPNEWYGRGVALKNDKSLIMVGAIGADPSGVTDSGTTYVYT